MSRECGHRCPTSSKTEKSPGVGQNSRGEDNFAVKDLACTKVGPVPKLFVLSVHFKQEQWLPIQRRFLDELVDVEHERLFAVMGIPLEAFRPDETTVEYDGDHGRGLDLIAQRALKRANDEDWLLFIDSDAFPLQPISTLLKGEADFLAVQRVEYLGCEHPHPSFALIRAGLYTKLAPSWTNGLFFWTDESGRKVSDVGSGFIPALRECHEHFVPLRRMRSRELHPVYFGIYGTKQLGPVVYHHGAGSKRKRSALEAHLETRQPISYAIENFRYHLRLLFTPDLWRLGLLPTRMRFSRVRTFAEPRIRKALAEDPAFWRLLLRPGPPDLARSVKRWIKKNSKNMDPVAF